MSSPVSKAGEARRWTLIEHGDKDAPYEPWAKTFEGETLRNSARTFGFHLDRRVREDKACEEDVEKAALAIFVVREDASTFEWGVLDEEERAPYLAEARAVVNVVFGGPDDNE